MTESDGALVEAVLAGRRESYNLLVERYSAPLVAAAYARLGDREAARDLAQDALVEAYRRLGELLKPDRFGAWVYGICRHRCADWLRRRIVERRESRRRTREGSDAPQRPDEAAMAQEENEALHAALAALPEADREIILLRYIGGLGREQTAALLGIRPAAADKRLQRGLARLRERF